MHPELSGPVCTYAINLSGLNEISGVRYCLVNVHAAPIIIPNAKKGGGIESDSLSLEHSIQFYFIPFASNFLKKKKKKCVHLM